MFRSKFFLFAIIASMGLLVAPATSQAAFSVKFKIGDTEFDPIADGNTGDLNSTAGIIQIGNVSLPGIIPGQLIGNDTIGYYEVSFISSAWSTATSAELISQTLFVVKNKNATEALTITVLEDAFEEPVANGKYDLVNKLTVTNFYQGPSSTTNEVGSVSAQSFASPLDAETTIVTATTATSPDGLKSQTIFNKQQSPYSLSQQFVVTLDQNASVHFAGTSSITPTPTPGGLVLLASMVPFAGLLRLRRRAAKNDSTTAA